MTNMNNFNMQNPNFNPNDQMFYNTMRNDPNLINRFLAENNMQNINTQNEEEMRLKQEEEMLRLIEDEEQIRKMKNHMKEYLNTNKHNFTYIKNDLFDTRRSEYFNERDRYFFEELILQPLITSGFLGLGNVLLDKSPILADKSKQNLIIRSNDEDYFNNLHRDGIYLDYIKKKVYSYNIQKLEQRLIREVSLENLFKIK